MLVLSETLINAGLSPRRPKEIRHPNGRTVTVTLGTIANHPPLLALRERMIDDLLNAALLGFGIALGVVVIALAGLHYAGGRLKRGRHLRGGELASARQLRRRVAPLRPRLRRRFGRSSDRPYRIAGIPLKFPGAWPIARIRLRYRKRPKVAERFVPWAEEKAGTGQVDMPEDDGVERLGEAKDAIERAPEAEAAVDLWESEPLAEDTEIMWTDPNAEGLEADAEPLEATQPGLSFAEDVDAGEGGVGGATRTEVDLDVGPDEDSKPPGATANRTDTQGRKSPDGAKPKGRMIRI